MKTLRLIMPLCLLLAGTEPRAEEKAAANSEHPSTDQPQPHAPAALPVIRPAVLDDIQRLHVLQDMSAHGDRMAPALQKALLPRIGTVLLQQDVTQDAARLAPAVAGYVLSGGNPQAADRLASAAGLDPRTLRLLRGAAAFMRADREMAAEQFRVLDPLTMPAAVAGRLALAQAIVAQDQTEKQRFLSLAIAAMPGSMIEESALRRSALAYADSGAETAFWDRTNRYIRRFPRSLYMREFLSSAIGVLVNMEAHAKHPDLLRFDLMAGTFDRPQRQQLYLELARAAARANLGKLAEHGARRLERLAIPKGQEWQIAQLYKFMFSVAADKSEPAIAGLRAIDAALLPENEKDLYRAAIAVAEQIESPPAALQSDVALSAEPEEKSEAVRMAEAAIAEAEQLMAEARQ